MISEISSSAKSFPSSKVRNNLLVKDPANTDWVDIDNIVVGDGSTATTNSFLNNFTGNFVWIRVSVTEFTAGTINNIFMAH